MVRRYLTYVCCALLAVFLSYLFMRLIELGLFYQTPKSTIRNVEVFVSDIPGPEDMEVDFYRNGIWIASANRCQNQSGGNIYFYDFENDQITNISVVLNSFVPHGIGLLYQANKSTRLFVVNHRTNGKQSIEIFNILDGPKLHHQITLAIDSFYWPNDVSALGPTSCYVTIVSKFGKDWGMKMDAFLNLRGGLLLFLDGTESRVVKTGLSFPNGIIRDGNMLYLSETISGQLNVYQIVEHRMDLLPLRRMFVQRGIDNISMDQHRNLWIAANPNMLRLNAHRKDTTTNSPFEVFRVQTNQAIWNAQRILIDSGSLQSGVSVAIYWDQSLILGTICRSEVVRIRY